MTMKIVPNDDRVDSAGGGALFSLAAGRVDLLAALAASSFFRALGSVFVSRFSFASFGFGAFAARFAASAAARRAA